MMNKDIVQNHHYPPESAGALMTTKVPSVGRDATVGDVESLLLNKTKDFDTINYIYVLDHQKKLQGVVSVKEVFRQAKMIKLESIIRAHPIAVRVHTDQERVALMALKYSLKAIPVVDKENHFLGAVPSDIILQVLHQESIEDILRSAGIRSSHGAVSFITEGGVLFHVRKRLPWLILGLFGGMLAAWIVRIFESSLRQEILLVAFIPTIVYMADAVGTQSQTVFIRSLALNHILSWWRYFFQEMKITIFVSALLSAIFAFLSLVWNISLFLSFVLGITLFVTILMAALIGVLLPMLFSRAKYDPALASGPFATIIRDVFSLVVYFGLIKLFLS